MNCIYNGWMKKAVTAFCLMQLPILLFFCCVPSDPYRREALVPGQQPPPYRGEPLGQKHVEIQAQIAGSEIWEETPKLHDPALWIPEYHINASILVGATDFLDLGLLFTYAHGSFAQPSRTGTPPMPEDGKDLFAIGPQIGVAGKFLSGQLFGGAYVSLQYVRIPWSEWERYNYDHEDIYSGEYRLRQSDYDHDLYYRVGLYLGGRPVHWLAINAGLVISANWVNDGFSNEPEDGSTLEHTDPVVMPVIGFRSELWYFFIESMITFPMSADSDLYFIPVGWSAALGVRF